MNEQNINELLSYTCEDDSHHLIRSRRTRIVLSVIITTIYIALFVYKRYLSIVQDNNINVFRFEIQASIILSIISQLQVALSIVLVILLKKMGYIINCIIVGISLLITVLGIIIEGNMYGLTGIITYVFTIAISYLVYRYLRISEIKYQEIMTQKEEIVALYEEIAASESTLVEQKDQLEECNTMLEEREEELNQLAFYDYLTGLPNRRMIYDQLDAIIQIASQEMRNFSIVFFDLDNFKKVNDSAGHLVGDELLRMVTSRWKKVIHKKDMLGRLGGDEFALIIQRPLNQEDILAYIKKINDTLQERFINEYREFYIQASYGISMYPKDGNSSEMLLKYADVAMHEAKKSKIDRIRFFNQQMQEKFQHNVQIESYLQQVLVRNELSIVFQPQFDCKTKKLRGFEALARWITKKMGTIPPKEFIPIAEENGMIISMGEWILRESCRICKSWMDSCDSKFILSVNVSAVQLLDTSFISMVDSILDDTGFDPNNLEVEVTESLFISSMESAINTLSQLKYRGITIALDDFGTGYASLSYLQNLPIDTIKIDKSFIDDIITEKKQYSLVKSIVGISHELSLNVIAEGVEHQSQLDVLENFGCDLIQGYLLGKPMDPESAIEVIKNQK